MPYTKEALQNMYSLSLEDVLATLTACGLTHDTQEYSDADIETRFDIVRQLFKDGQACDYEQATTLFQQRLDTDDSSSEIKNGKKSRKKATKTLDITELLIQAREQDFRLTLTQALKILAFCGLGEKDEYTPEETERFLATCNLAGEEMPDVSSDIEEITKESEGALAGLVDKVTDKFVEKIPPGLVKQVYAKKALARLAEQPDESEDFFVQMERRIMSRIEGKPSPMQALLEKHRMNVLPPTSIKSMQLPSASDSDTTTS
ncbi:hypothetical protein IQ244_29370 [Nostoc sp. LEGE 06077]|uniref:hypothetical protein n=1 Tax=Nostoc sp. LEGE 06077 TaxID=915325 RepID=UPI00188085A7|nr:hypothetical protein [Nostoc sp. LEGE 06077]MBE9210541.1 hypothetical protein [Nostoc sp. LEGE 06077]